MADDIHTLMAFYNQLGGAGQDFLFADPLFENNACAKQKFGVGDGEKTSFRLVRQYGDYVEPIFGVYDKPHIYVDGTEIHDFEWDRTGLITFDDAPDNGDVLRWTGRWFYRCHFQDDEAEFQQIFMGGWDLEEIVLESIKLE
jgi:uncharacterized protein (TIGR02217 family)